MNYGFSYKEVGNVCKPLCLICNESLAAESMKPSKLKRHFETKHGEYSTKSKEYFESLARCLNKQANLTKDYFSSGKKYFRASLETCYIMAQNSTSYTEGERVILPASARISDILHGKKYGDEVRKVPLSDTTVSRRVSEISNDQFGQLITRVKQSVKFAIQIDETMDISKSAQLLVYIRYIYNGSVEEDLLFCRELQSRTRGEDIFLTVDTFFNEEGLQWDNCVGVCTDGAGAMVGKRVGFVAKIRENSPGNNIKFTHCMIHREALAAKRISPELGQVLQDAVKVINFISKNGLNTRLFANLCKDHGAEYKRLLMHAEVRWLSRGYSMQRLLQLKEEVAMFLKEEESALVVFLEDNSWLVKLCYLSDIFSKLNDLNASLQGRNCDIFQYQDKIKGFLKKLEFWKKRAENGSLEMFTFVNDFIEENGFPRQIINKVVINHLNAIQNHFKKYFELELQQEREEWVRNPFAAELKDVEHLSIAAQEEFSDLSCNNLLRLDMSKQPCVDFWIKSRKAFPNIAELAINKLMPFCTTYLCESAFSHVVGLKTKSRASLKNVETVLRPVLSPIQPRFEKLCGEHQCHPSH